MCKKQNVFLYLSLLFSIILISSEVALAKTSRSKYNKADTKVVRNKKRVKAVNVNTADVKTLSNVKGIGKKTAEAIVNYRNKNGKFKYHEDLLKVNCRTINGRWLNRFRKILTL